jgi:hypothetical protein
VTASGYARIAYRAGLRVAEYQFGLEDDMRKAVWPTLVAAGFALFLTTTTVHAQIAY